MLNLTNLTSELVADLRLYSLLISFHLKAVLEASIRPILAICPRSRKWYNPIKTISIRILS